MKISLDWLGDFIDITEKDNAKIKEVITTNTAEIETMDSMGDDLDKVVVGKIVEIKKHPNADSLVITRVNDGQENVQVVCGGSNLREGMLVAFAKIGAIVKWHGTEVVKMEKAKIRGEESFGMICASDEIGLADMFPKKSEKEIVDLTHLSLKVGTPLAEALGLDDVVLDIDNHAITNRPDLFSHRGFSREFVANRLGKLRKVKGYKIPENHSPAPIQLDIKDKELCSHYMGVYLTDVEVKESPEWMKKRLIACGVNPISNVVDITNYVMLELGMPLHAFDTDRVKGNKWTMRKSKKGEKMTTLDGTEHELPDDAIVLDDGNGIIDLCGIMGGLTSGIEMTTNKVWLIAPVYSPSLVRKGMRALGQISDAAIIYEKGVDPSLAEDGLARAVALIQELCPKANVASQVMDIWNIKQEKRVLDLRMSQISRLVGIDIQAKEVEKILKNLGFMPTKKKGGYSVEIPTFRMNDVNREQDLIEEVARIYGYDKIPNTTPVTSIRPTEINAKRVYEKGLRNKLAALGFDEIYTFAFLGPELLIKSGMAVNEHMIEVENPISADMSLMRQSLLPRTLATIADNLRYQNEFKLFELSNTYYISAGKKEEAPTLIVAMAGGDFRELQGVVESLIGKVTPPKNDPAPFQHPGRRGEVILRGKEVGYLYEVHPQVLKNFDIKKRVVVAEIDIQAIHNMQMDSRARYKELSKYPAVQLDISILIPKKNLAADYMNTIQKTDQKLITGVDLVDEYQGEKVGGNERALTYSVTYQAADKTLTEEEVTHVHKQVLERLKQAGAQIR